MRTMCCGAGTRPSPRGRCAVARAVLVPGGALRQQCVQLAAAGAQRPGSRDVAPRWRRWRVLYPLRLSGRDSQHPSVRYDWAKARS